MHTFRPPLDHSPFLIESVQFNDVDGDEAELMEIRLIFVIMILKVAETETLSNFKKCFSE